MNVNLIIPSKQIARVHKSIKDRNDKAAYRTINWLEGQSRKEVKADVKAAYAVKQKSIDRRWNFRDKARKGKPSATWKLGAKRLGLLGLKATAQTRKGKKRLTGIEYKGFGKRKIKLNERMFGGSKPFVVRGSHSGKPVAVYVPAAHLNRRFPPDRRRPVSSKKLAGSSMQHLMKRVKYMRTIRNIFRNRYAKRYGIELDKAARF